MSRVLPRIGASEMFKKTATTGKSVVKDSVVAVASFLESQEATILENSACLRCLLYNENGAKNRGRVLPEEHLVEGRTPILIFGEAPGQQEDLERRPFVPYAPSGKMLRAAILRSKEIQQQGYVIANLVNCHPEGNRDPTLPEMISCQRFLKQLFEKFKPTDVIAVGRLVTNFLLRIANKGYVDCVMEQLRGRSFLTRIKLPSGYHYYQLHPIVHPAKFLHEEKRNRSSKVLDISQYGLFSKTGQYDGDIAAFVTDVEDVKTTSLDVINSNKQFIETYQDNIRYVTGKELLEIAKTLPDVIAVDLETVGDLRNGGYITHLSVATLQVTYAMKRDELLEEAMAACVTNRIVVVHYMQMELGWFLYLYGINVIRNILVDDTLVMMYTLFGKTELLGKPKFGPLSLGFATLQFLGINVKTITGVDRTRLSDYTDDDVMLYNALDAKSTLYLYYVLQQELSNRNMLEVYDMIRKNAFIATVMQYYGVHVDIETVKQLGNNIFTKRQDIETKLRQQPVVQKFIKDNCKVFKLTSSNDILLIFLANEEIRQLLEAEFGKISTGASILDYLVETYDNEEANGFLKLLLQHRKLDKLHSAFIKPLLEGRFLTNGKIHAGFGACATLTARLNSYDPNLMQMPVRGYKDYRTIIVVPDGYTMVSVDLAQIEFRIAIIYCLDAKMLEYIWEGKDIHGDEARFLLNEEGFYNKVLRALEAQEREATEENIFAVGRNFTKNTWTFPLIYLAGVKKLAALNSVPFERMKGMRQAFLNRFPELAKWQRSKLDEVSRHNYVSTLTGFKIFGPLEYSQITNVPIQHVAVNIINNAIYHLIMKGYEVNLQIHDQLVALVPDETLETAVADIVNTIIGLECYPRKWLSWLTKVPLGVEVKTGKNFGALKKYGVFDNKELLLRRSNV